MRSNSASAPGLDRQRHAGGIEAARQTDRRIAGQIERHGVGVPRRADVLDALVVDLDRTEEVLIDRHRAARQRRHRDDVTGVEPRLHLPIKPRALEDRVVQLCRRVVRHAIHLPHEGRAHDRAMLLQVMAELRHAVGAVVDEPHRLGILERRRQLRHLRAKLGERSQRGFAGRHYICRYRRVPQSRAPRNAQSLQIAAARRCDEISLGSAGGERVAQVRPGHRIEHECGVQHRTRHRRDVGDVAEPVLRRFLRHHAKALLEADHAVARRWNPRRTAAIGGDCDRHEACRNRDRRAAARTTRTAIAAPGIAGAAEQRRLRQALLAEFRRRGLAHHDGARLLQPRHRNRIMIGDVILEDQRSPRRAKTRCRDQILHRHRHAVQRPMCHALHHRVLRRTRSFHRGIGGDSNECVQHRLAAHDTVQRRAHDLDRRDCAGADQSGKFERRCVRKVHVRSPDHTTSCYTTRDRE